MLGMAGSLAHLQTPANSGLTGTGQKAASKICAYEQQAARQMGNPWLISKLQALLWYNWHSKQPLYLHNERSARWVLTSNIYACTPFTCIVLPWGCGMNSHGFELIVCVECLALGVLPALLEKHIQVGAGASTVGAAFDVCVGIECEA